MQGATKSVVNWVLTSSVLQKIHQQSVQGTAFESSDSTGKVTQSTVGFVDDNNNCMTEKESKSPIAQLLQ